MITNLVDIVFNKEFFNNVDEFHSKKFRSMPEDFPFWIKYFYNKPYLKEELNKWLILGKNKWWLDIIFNKKRRIKKWDDFFSFISELKTAYYLEDMLWYKITYYEYKTWVWKKDVDFYGFNRKWENEFIEVKTIFDNKENGERKIVNYKGGGSYSVSNFTNPISKAIRDCEAKVGEWQKTTLVIHSWLELPLSIYSDYQLEEIYQFIKKEVSKNKKISQVIVFWENDVNNIYKILKPVII